SSIKTLLFHPEVVMKQVFLRSLMMVALALSVTLPALADTVRLKDGSVIRGQIVNFKNEQFTILVGSGTRGRKSRITVYMEDVDSIEFDSAGSAEIGRASCRERVAVWVGGRSGK